jgi:hypothetical protein
LTGLIDLAADVMASHGWSTRKRTELANVGAGFDLVAENETAIVFFDIVRGPGLRARTDALAGAIGAITLRSDAGVKAWEAYLVLLVVEDYPADETVVQQVQRDLDYCRKIVLDGGGIAAAENPPAAMERALSFLFPLDVALAPAVADVRASLVDLIVEKGFDKSLITNLVAEFDHETDCRCWERVKETFPQGTPG